MEYKTPTSGGVDGCGCSPIRYWYRPNNGIRTREQAVQIRDYYNKNELPPYDEYEMETNTQALTLTPESTQAVGHTAPNLSVITIDADMENDTEIVCLDTS